MVSILLASGLFGWVATALGIAAAACIGLALRDPRRENLLRAGTRITIASVLLGLVGTGVGYLQLSEAIVSLEPEMQRTLWMRGTAIAWTATTVGAFWGCLNGLLGAVAVARA